MNGRLEVLEWLLSEMNNKELKEAVAMVKNELRLSNLAIKEGFEKKENE